MDARLIFSYDTNLPAHLAEYFLSINLPVYEAYGTCLCFPQASQNCAHFLLFLIRAPSP